MNQVDIAGLKISAIRKKELLDEILKRIAGGQKTFVTTPYSEFLYHAFKEPELLEVFNRADFAVADGIGIFWAKKFLDIPLTAKSYWGKVLQAAWQVKYSLAAIIFYPRWIKSALPEKIVGADLVWDLAKLAADNNLSIYLLGGFGDTSKTVAKKLTEYARIKCGRTLSLRWSNKNPNDPTTIEDINQASADILLVAYGPIKQEKWIADNLLKLNVKLAMGVGGTFDYIAGKKIAPPKFIRYTGLEWLWRLITQPYRFKRIINATFGLVNYSLINKIYQTMPLRKNAVAVILNRENKILVCRRNPKPAKGDGLGEDPKKFQNYWQLPQGGVGEHEDIVVGAKRETLEETGLKNLEFFKISQNFNTYQFPLSWERVLTKPYRWRGQNQNIVYFKFLGNDNEVKVDQKEFVDYQWTPINELAKTIHCERRNLTDIALADLKNLA